MNLQDFVIKYAVPARAAKPLPWVAVLAQSALESTNGKNAPGNNFFGIKAMKKWKAAGKPYQWLWTHEMIDGQLRRVKDTFRMYPTPEDSFRDYASLITNNPIYKKALESVGDEELYIEELAKAGYSSLSWFEYAKRVRGKLKEIKILLLVDNVVKQLNKAIKEVVSDERIK